VICDDGSNLPATQRAYHVDEVKENKDLKVGIEYFVKKIQCGFSPSFFLD